MRRLAVGILAILAGMSQVALSGDTRDLSSADADERGQWRLSAGPLRRTIGEISFRRGSRATSIANQVGAGRSGQRANVGTLEGYHDREYDDGFVRISPPTQNTGLTWYWGYENSSQIQGDSLVFHASDGFDTEFTYDEAAGEGEWTRGNTCEDGVFVAAERRLKQSGRLFYRIQFALSYVPFSMSEETLAKDTHTWTRYAITIEDRYDLGGFNPPGNPYSGTYSGPGFIVNNIPSARSELRNAVSSGSCNLLISETLDIDLTTVSLGIDAEYRIGRWHFRTGAGPAVAFVETRAMYEETLSSAGGSTPTVFERWKDKSSDSDIKVGLYVDVAVGINLTDRLGVGVFGRYDWLEDLSGKVGPSEFDVELAGGSFGCALVCAL